MPDFQKAKRKDSAKSNGVTNTAKLTEISVPQCHVCKSSHRRHIDKMLAMGTSYSELERVFEIDRRSISNHDKNHLNIEDAAIRHIIEREATEAQENIEEGIKGAVARRVYLESVVKKAQEALLTGDTEIEIRDAIAAIERLDKLDSTTSEAQIEEMRIQFHAFMQAVKEVVEEEHWDRIRNRTRALLEAKNVQTIETETEPPPS